MTCLCVMSAPEIFSFRKTVLTFWWAFLPPLALASRSRRSSALGSPCRGGSWPARRELPMSPPATKPRASTERIRKRCIVVTSERSQGNRWRLARSFFQKGQAPTSALCGVNVTLLTRKYARFGQEAEIFRRKVERWVETKWTWPQARGLVATRGWLLLSFAAL